MLIWSVIRLEKLINQINKRLYRIDNDINTLHSNQRVIDSNVRNINGQITRYLKHGQKKENRSGNLRENVRREIQNQKRNIGE